MSGLIVSKSFDDSRRSALVYWIERASMASTSACVCVCVCVCELVSKHTIGKVILRAIECIN